MLCDNELREIVSSLIYRDMGVWSVDEVELSEGLKEKLDCVYDSLGTNGEILFDCDGYRVRVFRFNSRRCISVMPRSFCLSCEG